MVTTLVGCFLLQQGHKDHGRGGLGDRGLSLLFLQQTEETVQVRKQKEGGLRQIEINMLDACKIIKTTPGPDRE